jgi:serine/threonine protein kinase
MPLTYIWHVFSSAYYRFSPSVSLPLSPLSRLLVFDPADRMTAEEALAHPYIAPMITRK